jgi:hypothetical protein
MLRWWGSGLLLGLVVVGCGSSSSTAIGSDPGTSSTATTPAPAPAPAPVAPQKVTGATLDAWQTQAPMPTARANHCSVVANGYLVVIGGNYKPKDTFVNLDDVLAAKIGADGALGAWTKVGTTPSPVNSCTAATDGTNVYLVDGIFDSDDPANPQPHKVRRAALDTNGVLSPWAEIGALPDGVRVLYSSAAANDGALRVFHSRLPDDGDAISLVRAPIAPGGSALGTWSEDKWLTGFRGHPQYVFADLGTAAFVYTLGGYGGADKGNAVLADGAGAALDASGAPGKSFGVTSLPKPTSFGQAIAVQDWVFVVGGKDSVMTGTGHPDVFAAHIAADGTLGAWSSLAALPQGRTSHAIALSRGTTDYLYVTGGGYDAGGLATVFSARVRFEK